MLLRKMQYSNKDTDKKRYKKCKFWKEYYYIKDNNITELSFEEFTLLQSVELKLTHIIRNSIKYNNYCNKYRVDKISSDIEIIRYTLRMRRYIKC